MKSFSPSLGLRSLVAGLIVAMVILNGAVITHQLARPPDHDEGEYLHAAWLSSTGHRLYRDYLEHHSPLLWASLAPLIPRKTTHDYPKLDVFSFLARARVLACLSGMLMLAALAQLAYVATRRALAPVVTTALILGSRTT